MADKPAPSADAEPIVLHVDPIVARLLPKFLEHRRRDVAKIRQGADQRDFRAMQDLGHNLKGTGRSYGCDAITEIGQAIEEAAKSGDADRIRQQAAALDTFLKRVTIGEPLAS
jgi:HPt (histidine-containing phosphotransfer) domain-containing protein